MRERERESILYYTRRERETETETDRQTDRQTDRLLKTVLVPKQ